MRQTAWQTETPRDSTLRIVFVFFRRLLDGSYWTVHWRSVQKRRTRSSPTEQSLWKRQVKGKRRKPEGQASPERSVVSAVRVEKSRGSSMEVRTCRAVVCQAARGGFD